MKVRNGFVSNSSSSSFLVRTDMSLELVQEFLQDLLNLHNKYITDRIEGYLFESVFSEPYKIEGNRIVIESNGDNSIPAWIEEFIEMKFGEEPIHGYISWKEDNDLEIDDDGVWK